MPYPHDPHHNPDVEVYESLSAAQRIDQIKSSLSEIELATLKASIAAISGNTMENTGLFDLLRWWALSGYSAAGVFEFTETYKIAAGQSAFARKIFEEALSTGNLHYTMDTAISSVTDKGNVVEVSMPGRKWLGKKLVCTIPLNVLSQIHFEPPLPFKKQEAIEKGHVNYGAKVHLETEGVDLRSWCGASWPSERIFSCHGDGLTRDKNAHVVCFASNKEYATPQGNAEDFIKEFKNLSSRQIQKVVSHVKFDPHSNFHGTNLVILDLA